ncbi:hypothetical protein [Halalkalibacillus sediminis]|uniref:hypothetical protein n=1 Tax=Halalkalibacillus sediminis TaxID=2018042 RepID=UPI00138FBEF2|nr:hypothetical protein [Halalkalibacillus sediminis]
MLREIVIPHDYVWMAKQSKNPGQLYKRYVAAYVRRNCPGWSLKRINKKIAVIEKIDQ